MEGFQNRIEYFERMVADNPDNPTGLLALANEYQKAERYEDEAAVLERYVASHPDYEPLTRGMQAALPHVDHFLAGNSLSSLEELAELMEGGLE